MKPKRAGEVGLFGTKLREYRERAGLTLTALAAEVRFNASHLSNVENGHRRGSRKPFAEVLDKYLKADGELLKAYDLDSGRVRPRECRSLQNS